MQVLQQTSCSSWHDLAQQFVYMQKQQILQGRVTTRAALAARAARRIEKLRTAALELEAHHEETLAATAPTMNKSARNLTHYLAVRSNDIRGLQSDLARLGLSSLGRMEAHTMASLEIVSELLSMIRGLAPGEQPTPASVSMISGTAMLARHSAAVLGPTPDEHKTRIMVTMPTEAADDPVLIRDLLAGGMQIMRINCAHDDREVWARMVLHLRRAEKRLGRTCKVCFDVAGPKLRTGAIEPGVGVIKWKPCRDPLGRVIEPAVVQLTTTSIGQLPGQWSIPDADALTAKARIGDTVELVDARGKHRRLKIVNVSSDVCTCHSDSTAYVTAGTELRLRRGKVSGQPTHLPSVPRPV